MMNRLCLLLSMVAAFWQPLVAAAAPNFVFIIADDLGWADVGFHGGSAPTPNLDKLVREGVELSQHYVFPVCSPTRATLLSGRYCTRFGVTSPSNSRAYRFDTMTLPRALKTAGYDTCITGKWHLGSKPEWGPNHFGFDHSYGSLAGGVGPWDHSYKKGEFSRTWHRNAALITEEGHVTDLITNEAVQWLDGRGAKPFFLYVPFTAVHLPIKEPKEWLDRVPASITGAMARHYAACVMHLDDSVGRIIAALEKTGKREQTLVAFTSDNGGSTAENAGQTYPPDDYPEGKLLGDNKPFRGEKGNLYEGGIRVPTIVNWPGKLRPGRIDSPLSIADWMPTFCALAGCKSDRDLKWDGQNIWPILSGETKAASRLLYWAGPGFRQQAIREGDWKLIVTKGARDKPGKDELFDLAKDPHETTDLAAEMPDEVSALKQKLTAISKADRDSLAKD